MADFYTQMAEATQKATKDLISFVEGVLFAKRQNTDGIAIPAEGVGVWPSYNNLGAAQHVTAQARFVYGSAGAGASAKFYLQSSLDDGLTWFDVICWAFTNQTKQLIAAASLGMEEANPEKIEDGELEDNKARQGVLGDVFRVKYVIVGDYVDSRISISGIAKSF